VSDPTAIPCADRDTERLVLGSVLLKSSSAALFHGAGLREDHFSFPAHQLVWRRVQQALVDHLETNPPTIRALLIEHNELDDVGTGYLTQLEDGALVITADRVPAYVTRLLTLSVGRQVIYRLNAFAASVAKRPGQLTDAFFPELSAAMSPLAKQLQGTRIPEHVATLHEVMDEVQALLNGDPPDFIDTPWPSLNGQLSGGFGPGEYAILGARPGVGKTAAALMIALRAAQRDKSVFFVTREMPKVQLGLRMIANVGQVDATRLRLRKWYGDDQQRIGLAMKDLSRRPVFMTHARLDVKDIDRVVSALTQEVPLGLVIVDYLQLISAPPGVTERRHQVDAVSAGLKGIALDYGVPVLCLSSLARSEKNAAPTLASLRESGQLEHDADTVLLMHRPETESERTEFIVAKARHGSPGRVHLYLQGHFQRFIEQTEERETYV
jgi:replicative DNA helicase